MVRAGSLLSPRLPVRVRPTLPLIFIHGCSVLTHQAAATGRPLKAEPITPARVICSITPSWASVKGGPVNTLKPEKKLAVITALTEGCSIRSVSRMTGVHKKTIMKVLVEVGQKCEQMMKE